MVEVTRKEKCLAELVGQSPPINKVSHLIKQVASTSATVLILGESGTGKELIARLIHGYSNRHKGPFVPVNCAAIPLELLESELFGHEKGSFTGAYVSRQGRFELADSGTLFLDEIGDMPLSMQAKLLRVLQEKTYERVGSNKSLKTNVRIIAATHKNLTDGIKEGNFRGDLFYRLNVFPIYIPALRERKEDIALLLNHFIHQYTISDNKLPIQIDQETLNYLENYDWPGNVRELANLVERLIILYPGKRITMNELPDSLTNNLTKGIEDNMEGNLINLNHNSNPNLCLTDKVVGNDLNIIDKNIANNLNTEYHINDITNDIKVKSYKNKIIDDQSERESLINKAYQALAEFQLPLENFDLKEHLAQLELTLIAKALNEYKGVVAKAAKRLGLRRTTLVEKMKKYGIERENIIRI